MWWGGVGSSPLLGHSHSQVWLWQYIYWIVLMSSFNWFSYEQHHFCHCLWPETDHHHYPPTWSLRCIYNFCPILSFLCHHKDASTILSCIIIFVSHKIHHKDASTISSYVIFSSLKVHPKDVSTIFVPYYHFCVITKMHLQFFVLYYHFRVT